MKKKNIIYIFAATAVILLIPLVAMQFSEDVNWKSSDFVIIGTLLIGMGLLYEFVSSKLKTKKQRLIAGVVMAVLLVLIWAELAVGLVGSPLSGS